MDNQKIGAFIATLRKEHGLTQRELGSRLRVSDRAVSKWERGLNLPDAALFEPLCRELGITLTELLRGEREEPTLPQLEQVVSETVGLASRKERSARRGRWAMGALCLLAVLGLLWCGRRAWQAEQLRRYYRQDRVVPGISLRYDKSYDHVMVNLHLGGYHAPLTTDSTLRDADLRIWAAPDSDTMQNTPVIRVDDENPQWVRADLTFVKEGLEVKVLRWPMETVGTRATLEDGTEIDKQAGELLLGEEANYPLVYEFPVEPGYLYSVVYLWGDGYWAEYPFRTTT